MVGVLVIFGMTNNKHEAGTGHGSAADRGSADKYYGRGFNPHRIINNVRYENLTDEAVVAYRKAYNDESDSKDWN